MLCKHCGTEIADKALICYRCGAAVAEPTIPPPAARRSRQSPLLTLLALIVLVLAALFMGQTLSGDVPQLLSWIVAGLAALVAVWRLVVSRQSTVDSQSRKTRR